MDALSQLLALYPLRTALQVRCQYAAPWIIDHAAVEPGIAPYHLLVSGAAILVSDVGPSIPLQAGDIVVFPQGSAHRILTEHAEQATPEILSKQAHVLPQLSNGGTGPRSEILCGEFAFDDAGSKVLLHALPALMHVRTAGRTDFAGLSSLIAMLHMESEAMRPGAATVLAQLSSALFALIIRAWLEQAGGSPGLFALLAERRLQAALLAMLNKPGHNWTLENMAALCHMSRATFTRLFARIAGVTPATVLLQIRMSHAAALLNQGKRNTGDVAAAVGYQSEAAFNRVFKSYFEQTPGAYRKQKRTV